MNRARIHATAEVSYRRRTDADTSTLLAQAFQSLLAQSGLDHSDIDGLGIASFTLKPDRCIDMAWRLGLNLSWSLDDGHGGASAINMLRHAIAAIECGHARHIALLSGDVFRPGSFEDLAANYNRTTRDYLAPMRIANPNTLFALLTQRHMQKYGLTREDYGALVISQRQWAAINPGAVYRSPLTMDDYLCAPAIADPLCLYDCVPVVAGANAILVSHESAVPAGNPRVRVLSIGCDYNIDDQRGDGLATGLHSLAPALYDNAALRPSDMDVISVYDDYPVMALVQLQDLGLIEPDSIRTFLHEKLLAERFPVNTSGGQLSAGQAGTAGGMHGMTEVLSQLFGQAQGRQLPRADIGLVSGYGMVEYRYGMCANAVILGADQ